jgi:hypothetical protein
MLVVISLVDHHLRSAGNSTSLGHFCKLLFQAPTKFIISNLDDSSGERWIIGSVTANADQVSVSYRLDLHGGGSIEVSAGRQHTFFW